MPHRDDDARRASGLLRGVLDRLIDLEQQVASTDAIPNLIRQVDEQADCTDTVSVSTESAGAAQYDQDSYDNARYQ